MDSLSVSNLLDIWENGVGRTPVEQALILLQSAFPKISGDDLAKLTIGQRDACLLQLRRLTFGPQITGLADCPACHEPLEMHFDIDLLQPRDVRQLEHGASQSIRMESSICVAPFEVTFRLPNSADLRVGIRHEDPDQARRQILEFCVLRIRKGEEEMTMNDLPPAVIQAVMDRMDLEDPLANLTLDATCPACQHHWRVLFDIVSFFWSEINAWAVRLMQEVHILASAYGWRESDILAMGARRRRRYLEMVGA